MTIEVTINGETHAVDVDMTVDALLRSFDLDPRKIAVEHNLEIVPRSTYRDVVVQDGDRLEIVHFVGGG